MTSVVFSTFTQLFNHHHYLIPEHFYHPRKKPIPSSLQPGNLNSIFCVYRHFIQIGSYACPFVSGFSHIMSSCPKFKILMEECSCVLT